MTYTSRGSKRRAAFIAAMLACAAVAPAGAHDFWISPSAFRPKVGGLIGIRLLVGQEMIGDPVPREPEAIKQFVVVNGPVGKSVPGRDGGDPAGIIRADAPGLLIVGYQSVPRPIELLPDKFDQYLGEEGLDEIKVLLAGRATKSGTAREMFSRCAKTLLLSGEGSERDRDRALGLTFEIVAEQNPYLSAAGRELSFALAYESKPRAGALVIATNQRDPSKKLSARSDAQGRVTFKFPVGGVWLVKAVHMIAARPGTNADWESYWASLTFDLAEAHVPTLTR